MGRISLPQLLKIPLRRTLTYSNSQVLKFLSGRQIPEGYDPSWLNRGAHYGIPKEPNRQDFVIEQIGKDLLPTPEVKVLCQIIIIIIIKGGGNFFFLKCIVICDINLDLTPSFILIGSF